jgi:periplasmic copper chaperone A
MIDALRLLVVAGLAAVGLASIATPATAQLVMTPSTPSPPVKSTWDIADGVPLSLSIQNHGDEADRLLNGTTPMARCVMIQRTRLVRGQLQTMPMLSGLVIPAGTTMTLEPGSSHLSLIGLQADLVQGDVVPLTLHFDRAGEVTVVARVRRKVDAAGIAAIPPVAVGDLILELASVPPAAAKAAN